MDEWEQQLGARIIKARAAFDSNPPIASFESNPPIASFASNNIVVLNGYRNGNIKVLFIVLKIVKKLRYY